MKYYLLFIGLFIGTMMVHAEKIRVVSYNVENLFHPTRDSLIDDAEWTPEGTRRWSFARYYRKEENIARVLTNIGEWDGVDVIGLQEVENAAVVKRLCYTMRRKVYDFVHYDSPDRRGIDVALIYKKARIDTIRTRAIRVDLGEQTPRDILYVCTKIKTSGDTIHFLVCHMPSQRGGKAESEWKREAAKKVLQQAVDSVFAIHKDAKIIVMGDMNDDRLEIEGMKELRSERVKELKSEGGTHKYQGRWTYLDHFYVSPCLDSLSNARVYDAEWIMETDEKFQGLKPKRTYNGFQYQNGFSDHLPIVMDIIQ